MICLAGRYDIYNDEFRWSGAFAAMYAADIAPGRSNETDRFCAVFSEISRNVCYEPAVIQIGFKRDGKIPHGRG